MKKKLAPLVMAAMIAAPGFSLAEKPEWAGQGKPSQEQKEAHRTAMQAKEDSADYDDTDEKIKKEKSRKEKSVKKDREEKLKGLEKQTQTKAEQQQKELDKGSEQGQQSREGRKKWWKFWG